MRNRRLRSGIARKIAGVFIAFGAVAFCVYTWYLGGIMTVSESYRVEDVSIYNTIYMLAAGDNIKQGFNPRDVYLTGIDVMLVNTSEESTGDIVVQILDMWGDTIGEGRRSLSEIPAGIYVNVPVKAELDLTVSEEFQVCIFSEGADTAPGALLVSSEEDNEDNNSLCYYNEEQVWDNGLVVGYCYGTPKFVGYEYQEKDIIWITAAKIAAAVLVGIALIYIVQVIRIGQIRAILYDLRIYVQLTAIGGIVALFFFTAIFCKTDTGNKIPAWAFGMLFLFLFPFLWSVYLYVKAAKERTCKKTEQIGVDVYTILICIASVLIRLPMFTHQQRWDGGVYYATLMSARENFDFTFESVWNYFRLANHPTFSYTFFMLMGEFLAPAKVTGVLWVTLILTECALICIYRMLRRYWCRMPARTSMIITLLISVTPLFLGTFSYINVDYTLVLFAIFLMYAEYRGQKILMAFWTVVLLLNKETGWMIVAGYYIAYLLKLWRKSKGKQFNKKVSDLFSDGIVKVMATGLLVVFAFIIRQGGVSGWHAVTLFASRDRIAEVGTGANAFGIYPEYIFHRLAQIFVLNFTWIPTGIILISLVTAVYENKKKRRRKYGKIHNMSGMAGALILFILFSVLYITAALSRYTIFSAVLVWVFAFVLFYCILVPLLPGIAEKGIYAGIAIFLLVQNFIYVDPVSNLIFDRLDSGKGKILSTDMKSTYYGDTLVNNYRYSYLDKLIDKMLAETEYGPDTQIVLWPISEDQTYINSMLNYSLGWDQEKKKRVIIDQSVNEKADDIIPLNMVALEELQAGVGLSQRAILYFVPYYQRDEEAYLSSLKQHYQIGERKEVSNWGGTLSYYILAQ